MNVYGIIYPNEKKEKKIKIFLDHFLQIYKYRCKFIFNNKLYPLQKYLDNININKKYLKIKLLTFSKIYEKFLIFPYQFYYKYPERKNTISNLFKKIPGEYYKKLFHKIHKMTYIKYQRNENSNELGKKIELSPEEKVIKIFEEYFVEKNKDKCIIAYKDRLFHLRENFFIKDMHNTDKKLEIFLIELKPINNCSHMFARCKLLEEYQLFENDNEQNKKEIDFENSSSNKYRNFYSNDSKSVCNINYSSISFLYNSNDVFNIYNYINDLIYDFPSFVTNMSFMFNDCYSLVTLPDMSL